MNLYVHFPFCRRKCTYCALHSRAGVPEDVRAEYVKGLAQSLENLEIAPASLSTVYFGGGSPALCDLAPVFSALSPLLAGGCEFTVELHPLDVSRPLLEKLRAGGVNRISMGVQSLDDGILRHMGRGYTFCEAERAFFLVKEHFDNAGIDLIAGYPGETSALVPRHARLAKWGLKHCSVYSLILEEDSILGKILARTGPGRGRRTPELPDDETVMDRIAVISRFLADIGLERYEISNYARPGFECRHNMAVWRGEDYIGLGEGAHGRVGLKRTGDSTTEVSPEEDATERAIFRLRTREGLDAAGRPGWTETLDRFAAEGLLSREGTVYRLTERGMEVCDSILAELV
ncbi:MAG: coproporphyrinogen III oxidase family protein [Kiritimatiellae bacterium]|nr:coproporphyrinogen III oxidase family protein [Kiritimatiellia bacterium]